jgi:predicted DNA-binding transcriptional regulator AlpA
LKRFPVVRPQSRVLNAKAVAARLGRSVNWFYSHYQQLLKHGFPAKDALLDGWDAMAIEKWMDRRAHLATESDIHSQEAQMLAMLERMPSGQSAGAE